MTALTAIDTSYVSDYSLVVDTEKSVSFQLGVIDSLLRAYLDDTHQVIKQNGDNAKDSEIENTALHDKLVQFVRFGLKGWKGFKDKNGNAVEFITEEVNVPRVGKREAVTDECMKMLDLVWIIELGLKIVENSTVTEQDVKN